MQSSVGPDAVDPSGSLSESLVKSAADDGGRRPDAVVVIYRGDGSCGCMRLV